jgi:TonB family protein
VYETAQLYNFYAFVHFDLEQLDEAASAYRTILSLPLSDLPDGLVSGTMRNLATLYIQLERYQDGLDLFERRMALPTVTATANDYHLIATILYQMERYLDAIEPLERAIAESEAPVEQHYQLLYVLYSQIDDQAGVLRALEILNERWPSDQWTRALENAGRQAAANEAAAELDVAFSAAGPSVRALSSDYLPIVHAPPVYPQPAAARGLEGYVVVSYTVTATGTTKDIEVIESSDSLFDEASIASVEKYKYRPRIVDGSTVEVPGVTTRIVFELESSDD